MVESGDLLSKLDLKDGYYHILIAPRAATTWASKSTASHWEAEVVISEEARADLCWWETLCNHGTASRHASGSGDGIACLVVVGLWRPRADRRQAELAHRMWGSCDHQLSFNCLELRAVKLTLKALAHRLHDRDIVPARQGPCLLAESFARLHRLEGTEVVDMFTQDGAGESNFAHPPASLIPRVLRHMPP